MNPFLAACIILAGAMALCAFAIGAVVLFKAWIEERENEAQHAWGDSRR